jgi:ABC-type transporter Mla subunit MlaD
MYMPNTTSKVSKAAALAQVQALIAGTQKHFPSGQFTLGNVAYTTASLVQLLQSLAAAMTAVATAQASAKDALTNLQSVAATVKPAMQAYVRYVRAAFNNATQSLADFGLQPPKARTPLTTEQKAAAKAKAAATRKARGTTSKKQKLAISGDVTGVSVTPITAPAASPTQPASTASSEAPAASPPKQ